MAAYSWNVMWLDCLALLPIIILGLEKLVKQNKVSMYVFALAISIWSNYYISIMICIFLVISMEIMNTAVERIGNYLNQEKDERIRQIKDLSGAAVLCASIGALIVCILCVIRRF